MRLKHDLVLSHSIKDGSLGSTIIASICIPTFNRYHHLTNLLRVLRAVDFDQTAYEILIIDNSNDTVAKTDFYNTARLEPNISVLHSSPPGVSRARNVGMEAARGRYVLFIDDDIAPIPMWLREIVDAFESCPDATIIGGPIRLIWPEGRPSWIPKNYECYLSALDHGTEFRRLANTEYLFSANMAFRADVLREFGGFPIDLGRRGKTLLLSNEEIKLQDDLRKAGCAIYYMPRALVYHTVDKERLDQGWFRRRLAWQSVSDAITEMRLGNIEQYLAKAAAAAGNLQIDHSFVRCFAHSEDPEVIAAQLEFLTWFTKAAISSRANLGQNSIEAISSKMRVHANESIEVRPLRAIAQEEGRRQTAIGLGCGSIIFVEAIPLHEHLYSAFGPAKNATLLTRRTNPYALSRAEVATLLDFLACAVSTARSYGAKLFFLTLDYWLKDSVYAAFLERIRDFPFAKFAILHLVPNVEEEIRRLQVIAKCLERIIVLSPDLKYDLEARFDLSNVEYLPHPAFIESYPSPPRTEIRTRLGIPEGRIAFSLLGELRDGKGVELLLEALPLLARQVRQRVFLLFGGKSTAETADLVSRALQANAVLGRVRLRQVVNGYAALTDPEFADLIRASDVGLLLYQRDQRMRMSRILPNYAVAGVPVITTANSYCGRLVAAESLGQVLVTETPQELASSIEEALELVGTRSFLPGLQAFAAQVSKRSVCECLSRLISERPIIRSADANATAESQS